MSDSSSLGTSSLIGGPAHAGAAIDLYARPSTDFAVKLEATIALLKAAALEHPGTVVQATSLGVEDMVVTDLIARQGISIAVATLETGQLHPQTSALIGTIESHYAAQSLRVGPRVSHCLCATPRRAGHVPKH
jgi:phosphoadenosine phosphosulfate reductase